MAKFRKVEMEISRRGQGNYIIYANYKGRKIKAYTNDSECYDWLEDDSNKEMHMEAKRHAYYKIVAAYENFMAFWGENNKRNLIMANFIDITKLKFQEPFKFKGGRRVYWAIGYCDDYENFEYCDVHNKKFKKSAMQKNLVRRYYEED